MAEIVVGGCFCGSIRYEITGPPRLQLLCFCTDCLRTTGTSGYAGYMVADEDFRVVSGTPAVHAKTSVEGRTARRHFCPECGSNLFGATELGLTSVAAGTLDDPALFRPTAKVFAHDAPVWGRVPTELESI